MAGTYTTNLQIINRALQILGSNRIISMDDKTNMAEEMSAAYRITLDNLIRSYNWNCCIKEGTAPLVEKKTGEVLSYVYALPADYLKLIRINDIIPAYSGTEAHLVHDELYKIRGKLIYTKLSAPLKIEYCYRNEDVSDYDPLFCEALAYRLAMAVCEKTTQSTSKYEALKAQYKDILADALRCNALEVPAVPKQDGNWILARGI